MFSLQKVLLFLLFIRNFKCSDRGADVIKARHPSDVATSRKSPPLSCSIPRSLFCIDYFLCLELDILYFVFDVLSVFLAYRARDLNLIVSTAPFVWTASGAIGLISWPRSTMSYKWSLAVTENTPVRNANFIFNYF